MDIGTRRDGSGALYVRLSDVVRLIRGKAEQQREGREHSLRGRSKQMRSHAENILDRIANDLASLEHD